MINTVFIKYISVHKLPNYYWLDILPDLTEL